MTRVRAVEATLQPPPRGPTHSPTLPVQPAPRPFSHFCPAPPSVQSRAAPSGPGPTPHRARPHIRHSRFVNISGVLSHGGLEPYGRKGAGNQRPFFREALILHVCVPTCRFPVRTPPHLVRHSPASRSVPRPATRPPSSAFTRPATRPPRLRSPSRHAAPLVRLRLRPGIRLPTYPTFQDLRQWLSGVPKIV